MQIDSARDSKLVFETSESVSVVSPIFLLPLLPLTEKLNDCVIPTGSDL